MKIRNGFNPWVVLSMLVVLSSIANAQATRTWVSGVGDDANPCDRTAPCKTFAGAISKTAASGEIDCLDPGGFGGVTITKAITIDCHGTLGSVLVSGTNAIVVAAGSSDVVNLRNLEIQGLGGSGLIGVSFLSGRMLHLENVSIYGFGTAGVSVSGSTFLQLRAHNLLVTDSQVGITVTTSSGTAFANLSNVTISNVVTNAIQASTRAAILVRDSTLSLSGVAFNQTGSSSANLTNCQITNNGTGIQSVAGSGVGLFGNTFILNSTALNPNSGTIYTDGNNEFAGNGTIGSPNGGNPGFKM